MKRLIICLFLAGCATPTVPVDHPRLPCDAEFEGAVTQVDGRMWRCGKFRFTRDQDPVYVWMVAP